MDEIKLNTVEGNGRMFCHTCLSGDRSLYPLGKYTDIYCNISSSFAVIDLKHKMVCWECAAILRKIKLFQAKIEQSQRLLLSYLSDKQSPLPTLSSLTSTNIKPELALNINFDEETKNKTLIEISIENINNEIFNEEEDTKNLLHIQVKEESMDDFEYNTDSNIDLLDVIKTEEDNVEIDEQNYYPNGKKKYRVNKLKEYKLNNKITIKKLKEMCKLIYVGFGEVEKVCAMEKDSDSYKCRYKCKTCVLSWPKIEDLKQHCDKFHKMYAKFVCDYCQCRFESKKRLSRHILRHRELYECRSCGHRAAGRDRMARHLANEHRVGCNACEATFRTVHLFFKHYKQYHDLFICDYCGRKCRLRGILEKHIKNHHSVKYRCEICNIEFKTKTTYKGHNLRKHVVSAGEEAYCVECDRQFNNVFLYKEHVASWVAHQRDKDGASLKRKCSCPECGRTYARRESMRNHYNFVHMKQSKYVCLECDKQFLNRTKYVTHMKFIHEGKIREKNKICNICGRGFATNKILTNHIRTHTGERPFECAQCPARFTQKQALSSHVSHVHRKLKRAAPAAASRI